MSGVLCFQFFDSIDSKFDILHEICLLKINFLIDIIDEFL